jgi:hypothetical protein
MKSFHLFITLSLLLMAGKAHAQWQSTTYTLKGGWNAIYLSGNATHDTIDNLFPSQVQEVWRWNPNPTQVQFTESPLIPSAGTPEWSVWKRGIPLESTLTQLTGQTAYLVKCSGTAANTYTASVKQAPLPPSTSWVRNGANLLGFPTLKNGATYPLFSTYFATFSAATAANTKIYKYIGGDLGSGNPLQVFSPTTERLDRTQAYWFSAEVVGNFYAPLEISLSASSGMTFGRTGSLITVRVRNRSTAAVTLTLAPVNSETAPASQTGISGPVPLTKRSFNATTLAWTETPITAAYTEAVGPSSTVELNFGINRADSSMTAAAANALFASFLRITDSGNLMDVYLPASAQKASLAGLWVGDISLTNVGYASGSQGSTPQSFPLRTLLHVADDGTARLLPQVFIGQLAAGSNDVGLCTLESFLKQDAKATAQRLVAAHMPLDQVITSGSGSVGVGNTLVRTITIPYNDATNPFVHQYHPDHDNKNARFQPVGAGVESYDITRNCTFTFTASPPSGSTVTSGWGSSVIGGTYSETITGIHKNDIKVTGTFELRRASELGAIATQ